MARLGMKDIDMAEVHDCFTISEIVVTEELGLCRKGDGGPFVAGGGTGLGGAMPMNTRGGLLGMGHPLGATGISQVLEVLKQVRGDVPRERAVGEVTNALVHNLSGAANVHSVMVLGRDVR
jgi:acetyl-CoA C-acetyltransferase